jgi:hypothetical protein
MDVISISLFALSLAGGAFIGWESGSLEKDRELGLVVCALFGAALVWLSPIPQVTDVSGRLALLAVGSFIGYLVNYFIASVVSEARSILGW